MRSAPSSEGQTTPQIRHNLRPGDHLIVCNPCSKHHGSRGIVDSALYSRSCCHDVRLAGDLWDYDQSERERLRTWDLSGKGWRHTAESTIPCSNLTEGHDELRPGDPVITTCNSIGTVFSGLMVSEGDPSGCAFHCCSLDANCTTAASKKRHPDVLW